MKRLVVVLTIIASVVTVLYHLINRTPLTARDRRATSATPTQEPAPLLQFQIPSRSAIGNLDVWNLKPFVPLGPMPKLKDMFKPVYMLVKKDRAETLQRTDRPNESWELQGFVMRGKQPRALVYNSGLKKMKNVGVGDMVDEQLVVRSIGSGSVTIEAKDDKKPQRFVLHIFDTQKDSYAIKRKVL